VADDHGVFLMEAMWMKFSPAIRRAIEIVRSGRIGEIRHLQAGLGYPVPPDGPPRFWDAALGGGALFDMGVYQIALARQLFGDPQSVTVTGDMRPDGVDLHETYTFEFETGATAQLITSITSFIPPRAWLGGTRGTLDPDVRRPAASGSPGTATPRAPSSQNSRVSPGTARWSGPFAGAEPMRKGRPRWGRPFSDLRTVLGS